VILLGALGALLVLTVLSATYRTRRRSAPPAPAEGIERANESRHVPGDDVARPLTGVARGAPIPEPPTTDRVERVKALQNQLSCLGFDPGHVDGRYGPLTTGAVRRFQEARDLPVDGVVGPLTADALRSSTRQRPTTDRIERVKSLQRQLTALGFEPGLVDGRYGPYTTEAVKRFQQAHDLRVDGIVDPLTQRALEQHAF
jgi:peptidoglycan hydrolase-like protein with peptidoglycan-binding domain